VLIVDDLRHMRRTIARALARLGVEVVLADSCTSARSHAGSIDVAIVDFHLGDGLGDDLALELLRSPRLRGVVFFTAIADERVLEQLRALGRVVRKLEDGVSGLHGHVVELLAR
jgi:DNA-binding response OmpR family regulator